MSRVLVTGGAGYVGPCAPRNCFGQGYEVSVVDNLSTGHRHAIPEGAEFHHLDIGDAAGMREVLASKTFDAVFHFAAKALIPNPVTNPAAFYQYQCRRGDHDDRMPFGRQASSASSFRRRPRFMEILSEVPIPEEHPKAPVNSYGETKLAFERLLRMVLEGHMDIRFVCSGISTRPAQPLLMARSM